MLHFILRLCGARVVVCNKLSRLAFAIAKSVVHYNKEYRSAMPKIYFKKICFSFVFKYSSLLTAVVL